MIKERLIGRFTQAEKGPLFICIAGIHGNEHAGLHALQKVFTKLRQKNPAFKGEFLGIAGNIPAIQQKKRFLEIDLNRQWHDEKIKTIDTTPRKKLNVNEDQQQKELITLFKLLLRRNSNRQLVLLDLHTTSAEGGTFSIANDHPDSLALGKNLIVPVITGIEKVIKGTTLNYFTDLGFTALGFEAGQHDNPKAIDRIEAAIWLTLDYLGCIKMKNKIRLATYQSILKDRARDLPKVVDFKYRHAIGEQDNFEMNPGYRNFQSVAKAEILAKDNNGSIQSEMDGMILMPLYQKQGEDGFFIVEPKE